MATDTTRGYRRDALFYGLRTERPYDCRLEHLRVVVEPEARPEAFYEAVAQALTQRLGSRNEFQPFGVPTVAAVPELGLKEATDRSWTNVRGWQSGARTIFLARAGSTVQVMSQTDILASALRADERLGIELERYGVSLLTWEVANAVRPIDSQAAELILSSEAVIANQEATEQAALRLLQARSRATDAERRAMLSLSASFVVSRLFYMGESWQRDRPGLTPLLAYGVRMRESQFDQGIWSAFVDFGEDIQRRRPGTRWGQLMFLERLSGGWTDFPDGDQYRHVIDQGTAWLKAYPGSPFAVTVMGHVARAYETWWSLSLAPDDEEFVRAEEHRNGAEEARLQAIRWYERILREAPTSVEAAHARRVIVQITVGVDTGERMFFSVYA